MVGFGHLDHLGTVLGLKKNDSGSQAGAAAEVPGKDVLFKTSAARICQ